MHNDTCSSSWYHTEWFHCLKIPSSTYDLILYLKLSPRPRSLRFSLMSSSRSFIVLHLTFRYMVHFDFMCVCERQRQRGIEREGIVRSVSRFFLFAFACRCPVVSSTSCWKDYPLSILPLPMTIGYFCVDLLLGSLFCSTGLFFHQYHTAFISIALF